MLSSLMSRGNRIELDVKLASCALEMLKCLVLYVLILLNVFWEK